jgi:DNA (cytosine-5)-methyltransferase 1
VRRRELRIGSLFAGIGGLELGLERAGVGRTVWQVEKDEFCRRVLARHWPDAVRYEDVTTVDWSQVEPVEVLCGGFPCQPFSTAGRMRGQGDERWMWPEFADAIRALRPGFVVVENVPALLRDADAFGVVLGDLAALGFDAEWGVLSAAAAGATQRRPRLFLVAYANDADGVRQRMAELPVRWRTDREVADEHRCRSHGGRDGHGGPWVREPNVGRMVDGLRGELDRPRLRALGNAVVPQVAEVVGRRLVALAHLEERAA